MLSISRQSSIVMPIASLVPSALFDLVEQGNFDRIKWLFQIYPIEQFSTMTLVFALTQAAIRSQPEILRYILRQLDPNDHYDCICSAFDVAVFLSDFNIVQRLIPLINTNDLKKACLSSLGQYSDKKYQYDIVRSLVTACIRRDQYEFIPQLLINSSIAGCKEIVEELLSKYHFSEECLKQATESTIKISPIYAVPTLHLLLTTLLNRFPSTDYCDLLFIQAVSSKEPTLEILAYLLIHGNISSSVQIAGLRQLITRGNLKGVICLVEQGIPIISHDDQDNIIMLALQHQHVKLYRYVSV
jgi:hypothetical protein